MLQRHLKSTFPASTTQECRKQQTASCSKLPANCCITLLSSCSHDVVEIFKPEQLVAEQCWGHQHSSQEVLQAGSLGPEGKPTAIHGRLEHAKVSGANDNPAGQLLPQGAQGVPVPQVSVASCHNCHRQCEVANCLQQIKLVMLIRDGGCNGVQGEALWQGTTDLLVAPVLGLLLQLRVIQVLQPQSCAAARRQRQLLLLMLVRSLLCWIACCCSPCYCGDVPAAVQLPLLLLLTRLLHGPSICPLQLNQPVVAAALPLLNGPCNALANASRWRTDICSPAAEPGMRPALMGDCTAIQRSVVHLLARTSPFRQLHCPAHELCIPSSNTVAHGSSALNRLQPVATQVGSSSDVYFRSCVQH